METKIEERFQLLERMLSIIEQRLTDVETKLDELTAMTTENNIILNQTLNQSIRELRTIMWHFESRLTRLENIPKGSRKLVKTFSV